MANEEYMDDTFEEEGIDQEAADEEEFFTEDGLSEEEEDTSESLDSFVEEGEQESVEEQPQPSQGTSEPGYVQRRIDKALARERDNIKAEVMAEMEAQYAPIKERLLEMDAMEMVRKGTVKDLETAKELLRYRQGQAPVAPTPAPQAEQPRQQNGQFAPKEDPATSAKIDMLAYQADKIKAQTGVDVISEFTNNPDIKQKVINGEMDFYDVAEMMKPTQRRHPPAPMRSPNGASGQTPLNAIETMSDEQFERMERRISEGGRFHS